MNTLPPRNDPTYPDVLKEMREKLGWTAAELAAHAGVGVPTIYNIEKRKRDGPPWASTDKKLRAALKRGNTHSQDVQPEAVDLEHVSLEDIIKELKRRGLKMTITM